MKKELSHEVVRQTLHELREALHALESGDVTITSFAADATAFQVWMAVDDPVRGPTVLRVWRQPDLEDCPPFPPVTRADGAEAELPYPGDEDPDDYT